MLNGQNIRILYTDSSLSSFFSWRRNLDDLPIIALVEVMPLNRIVGWGEPSNLLCRSWGLSRRHRLTIEKAIVLNKTIQNCYFIRELIIRILRCPPLNPFFILNLLLDPRRGWHLGVVDTSSWWSDSPYSNTSWGLCKLPFHTYRIKMGDWNGIQLRSGSFSFGLCSTVEVQQSSNQASWAKWILNRSVFCGKKSVFSHNLFNNSHQLVIWKRTEDDVG